MKKFLLSLTMVAMAVAGYAQDALVSITTVSTNQRESIHNYSSTWKLGESGSDQTWSCYAFSNNDNGWQNIRCGHSKNAYKATITTDFAIAGAVDKVVVNMVPYAKTADKDKLQGITLEVSSNADFSDITTTVAAADFMTEAAATAEDVTFNISAPKTDCYYRITFDCAATGKNNGYVHVNSIKYFGEAQVIPGQDLTTPSIELGAHNTVTIYQAEEAQVFYTTDGTSPLADGVPSATAQMYDIPFAITAPCTVKAAAYEDGSFSAVASAQLWLNEVSSISEFISNASATSTTLAAPVSVLYKNGRYLWVKDATDYILVYNADDMEIPALVNGQKIAEITGTFKLQNTVPEIIPSAIGAVTDGAAEVPAVMTLAEVVEGDASLVNHFIKLVNVNITAATSANNYVISQGDATLTGYNQFANEKYYDVLEVPEGEGFTVEGFVSVYGGKIQFIFSKIEGGKEMETVATPVIMPASGSELEAGDEITISCATEGATIYYTTDESDPANGGTVYNGAIEFTGETMTVKAIATKTDWFDSEVATATYTVAVAGASTATVDFTDSGNAAVIASREIESNNSTAVDSKNNLSGVSFTVAPVAVVLEKAEGGTSEPRWWASATIKPELRVYKNNTITVGLTENGYRISKVQFVQGDAAATNFKTLKLAAVTNLGETAAGTWDDNAKIWIAPDGGVVNQVVFTVDPKNNARLGGIKIVCVEDADGTAAGINAIDADNSNAPVEYYNLQGIRLGGDNLPAGIYIRRQGNDVKKVHVVR